MELVYIVYRFKGRGRKKENFNFIEWNDIFLKVLNDLDF